jgi:hypothetical protein
MKVLLPLLSSVSSPSTQPQSTPPRVIIITSNGVTKKSHRALPGMMKIISNVLLTDAFRDKRAAEHLLASAISSSGADFGCSEEEVKELEKVGLLEVGWKELTKPIIGVEALVVRPSRLVDGECLAEAAAADAKSKKATKTSMKKDGPPFRTGPEDLPGAWKVSRKDVAWFIAKVVMTDGDAGAGAGAGGGHESEGQGKGGRGWEEWKGKAVTISY